MLPGVPGEEAEKEGMNREGRGEYRADSVPRRAGSQQFRHSKGLREGEG